MMNGANVDHRDLSTSKRQARVFTLQILYQLDFGDGFSREVLKEFWMDKQVNSEIRQLTEFLTRGVYKNLEEIDDFISKYSKRWKLERMAAVDRNILRMSIFEFMECDTPKEVIIDEAIEISKEYAGDQSYEFINGVLDKVIKNLNKDAKNENN